MCRLRTAFKIAGLAAPLRARTLAQKMGHQPPISLLELVRAVCKKGTIDKIEHFFVLVLENRSFDHIFGLSQITGKDAWTGEATTVRAITSGIPAQLDAGGNAHPFKLIDGDNPFLLKEDVGHEFKNVKRQMFGMALGEKKEYPQSAPDNSGFIADREKVLGQLGEDSEGSIDDPIRLFSPAMLPVLTTLAREFAVCDNWFSSVPGPTFPNRMFIHAASSDGINYSPGTVDLIANSLFTGYEFDNGNIFDRLDEKDIPWCVYVGDSLFNQTVLMDGIALHDLRSSVSLGVHLAAPGFDRKYVFIEPTYDPLNDYVDGNSMHPLNDPARAEALVKRVYEAIRGSRYWERSALIITFDEHGGFFDHVVPPGAPAPGDATSNGPDPEQPFDFTRLGPRVPAIVISPLVPKNLIDHQTYDHTSILSTISERFGLRSLTQRDAGALPFSHLFQLTAPRGDTPLTLPDPAPQASLRSALVRPPAADLPDELPIEDLPDSIQTFIAASIIADRKLQREIGAPAPVTQPVNLRTLGDARRYSDAVRVRLALAEPLGRPPRPRPRPKLRPVRR